MQQKTEIPFSDLTMEDRSEVSRVLLFWNRPHPAFVNDEVIARLVKQTDGPFQINFVTEPDRAPAIDIVFEGGFAFNFSLYKWDIGIEEATQLFNEFIEQNLDVANDYFLDHPKWLGL
ncbi:hypothetical protein FDI21_gp030 [Pseudomonas phage Noxifer]|uniref:Uncharacterized protein n=1 Tax=Pseudomonas phage Noxifer TaxID=2006684 RepID=A0A1Y0SUK1_9CAUD|nr:hypothetical protein FDI21_gp030 [Pseudomonas phage Noxifer]ARV77201.1 hypothetical protein NOXIFER_30 [Pseudomonas phage Noxifer]